MRAFGIILIAGCGFHSPAGTSTDPDAGGSMCPVSYSLKIHEPSRYRVINNGHPAWEQSDACNQDTQGATHLAVIETPEELTNVKTLLMTLGPSLDGGGIWIGAVQRMSATSPGDGWLGFDGENLFNGWGGSEPSDGSDNDENDHSEQFVVMEKGAAYFIDISGNSTFGALCECDGKPIAPAVAALVDSYH
jgi:hypothetical protein